MQTLFITFPFLSYILQFINQIILLLDDGVSVFMSQSAHSHSQLDSYWYYYLLTCYFKNLSSLMSLYFLVPILLTQCFCWVLGQFFYHLLIFYKFISLFMIRLIFFISISVELCSELYSFFLLIILVINLNRYYFDLDLCIYLNRSYYLVGKKNWFANFLMLALRL